MEKLAKDNPKTKEKEDYSVIMVMARLRAIYNGDIAFIAHLFPTFLGIFIFSISVSH